VADALQDRESMARLLRLARLADPDPEWGDRLREPALWGDPEALRRLAAEAQQRLAREAPENGPPIPLVTLLAKKLGQEDNQVAKKAGQEDNQAEPLLRAAQGRHPEDFWLNYTLGEALRERKPAEAVGFYRAALAMRPTVSDVYFTISRALLDQGQVDEAMRASLKAVELDPKGSAAHGQLGICWQAQGKLDEAVAEYRRVIELDPKGAPAHSGLGICWQAQGKLDEAMAEYRRAIELDPMGGSAHYNLGRCWQDKGQLDEAMAEYRRAIELDPKGSPAHNNLGACWQDKGKLDEAVAEYRRAIELDPKTGTAHTNLPDALLRCGRFAEARSAIRRSLDLLPAQAPERPSLHEQMKRCEWMLAIDGRLPALLQEKERPDEQLEMARSCRDYWPKAAVGLYAAAFASRPALADDLETRDRYYAACAAARAAAGEGPDGARLGGLERAGLRRQALAWLQADLELRTRLFKGGKSVDWAVWIWQTDTALCSVRDPAALAKLPTEERETWQRLWADVAALRAADPRLQGRTHAAGRQWAQAADAYARALKTGPTDDGHFWFEYAALSLLAGDRSGYARACAHMIERYGKAGGPRAYHVARACTLSPDAVAKASLPGRLAEKELQDSAREFWSLTEQGALTCRAGRFHEAVALFEQSLRADAKSGRAVVNWVWLALANQRLGKAEEARRWLGKAQAWLDQFRDGMPARADEELGLHFHNWLEAHVLRREAEALLSRR
jgi:tetratricopeptide (TPR) repeat protein